MGQGQNIRFPGCTCPDHQPFYQDWPWENAELTVSTCMRTCPYCNSSFLTTSNLRSHLKGITYRNRNLTVKHERNGRRAIRYPTWRNTGIHRTRSEKPPTPISSIPLSSHLPKIPSPPINTGQSTVENLKYSLQQLEGFDPRLIQTLTTCSLSEIHHIPRSVQSLWCDSTTSLPQILAAARCWPSGPPGFQEVWIATARLPKKGLRVYEHGEMKGDPNKAYCQLAQPDPTNPTCIMGATPASLIAQYPFQVSEEYFETATPYLEQQVSINITPTFSVVQIHIDFGMEGLSVPVGDCVKIWVMWPPTEKNLSLMANENGQLAKLIRLAPFLEGGIILQTDSTQALTIPSGCLHATLTVKGGFLVSKDFATRYTIRSFSRYLAWGLQEELDEEAQKDCYYLYLDCLAVALANGGEDLAIEGWIGIERVLQEIAKRDKTWQDLARSSWKSYLNNPRALHITNCPCGVICAHDGFAGHFENTHMQFLSTDSSSTARRCRSTFQCSRA